MSEIQQENGLLILEQTNFLKRGFVHVLKTAFGSQYAPKEYRYNKERKGGERKLAIYRAWPKRTSMLPAIMVECDPADVSIKSLGQEIIGQVLSDDRQTLLFNTYGGVMWVTVKLTIHAKTNTDRERITDLTGLYIRFAARNLFAKFNIEYLDIQAGDAGEEIVNGIPTFMGTVTVKVQSEFKQDVDMRIYDEVLSINLDSLRFGTKQGDLEDEGDD